MQGDDTLNRPVLLPDADSFSDVLKYLGEWGSWWGTNPQKINENEIGPYCTIDLSQIGGKKHRAIAVRPTRSVVDAVTPRIVTPDDRLSFRIIAHEHSGEALVILEHGYIIGSHWLAYIDPSTIPTEEQEK